MQYAHPPTIVQRPGVPVARAALGCGCAGPATGAIELPEIHWKQVVLGAVVGLGLGYVLFATK